LRSLQEIGGFSFLEEVTGLTARLNSHAFEITRTPSRKNLVWLWAVVVFGDVRKD
jgi:hypothetical protein